MNAASKESASLTNEKHFSSSILLWVRTDQPRETGMDYWKGPHSGIISATKGLQEYRQIHMVAENPGIWPAIDGVETSIPVDRKIDGVAEVTFRSAVSPVFGRKQNKLAFKDEINVFRRTLLYAGPPGSSRWYDVAHGGADGPVGARAMIYLRKKDGVSGGHFRRFFKKDFIPTLASTGVLTELRTQSFLPWVEKLWDTPNVAHDNPTDQHLHASVSLGFADQAARRRSSPATRSRTCQRPCRSPPQPYAYDVSAALTYVRDGIILPHYEQ